MRLTKLNGVGDAKAERLKDHGYDQVEDVAFANPIYLEEEVPKVSTDVIQEAILEMQEFPAIGYRMDQNTISHDAQGTYWCEHCGQKFKHGWILEQEEHLPPRDKENHNCNPKASLRSTLRNKDSV